MSATEILVAAGAALAILLIAFGVAGAMGSSRVRDRLTQLGTPDARNLEELELQAPLHE